MIICPLDSKSARSFEFKLPFFGFLPATAATANDANATNDESSENRAIQSAWTHGTKADARATAKYADTCAKYECSECDHAKYWHATAECSSADGSNAKSNSNTADSTAAAAAAAKSNAANESNATAAKPANATNWSRSKWTNAIREFGTARKCRQFQCEFNATTAANESRPAATNQHSTATTAAAANTGTRITAATAANASE